MIVKSYHKSLKESWDTFVGEAKNATFLFRRDYMEYHADRFEDYSLLIYNQDQLVGLFPANKVGHVVYSHQGLSYGGMITSSKLSLQTTVELYLVVLEFLEKNKIATVQLKLFPSFYARQASNEATYLMHVLGAKKINCNVTLAIDQQNFTGFSTNKKRKIKSAQKHELKIVESRDLRLFWEQVLVPNLKTVHGITPVHSFEEMELLQSFFEEEIKLYTVIENEVIVAGALMYLTKQVAHVQYMSATAQGKKIGALDFLMEDLIMDKYTDKAIFDFGVVNDGEGINWGLTYWKGGFGAQTYCQVTYEIETKNTANLKRIIE